MTSKSKWDSCFEHWKQQESKNIIKVHGLMHKLKMSENTSLSMFFIALNQIQMLNTDNG
jgi:NAD-specific glutamate dehydrogenase